MRLTGLLLMMMVAACGLPARAEHARITLEIHTAAGEQATAHVDQTPPESGKNPRPVIHAPAGKPLRIQWILTNVYPNKTLKNVVVHFFIVRQERVGQKEIPALDDHVVIETAFDMDFQPGGKAGGRQTLRIDEPGVYLVRVETRQTQSDHEHFSAIDLVIDPE